MFRTIIDHAVVTTRVYVNYNSLPRKSIGCRKMSCDTIIALCIPIGCIALFIEAYYRSNYNDADTSIDAQFIPSNDCIRNNSCNIAHKSNMNDIVQTLERDGIVIIPNVISLATLNGARRYIQKQVHEQQEEEQRAQRGQVNHKLQNLSNISFHLSSNDSNVRQDMIAWIRSNTNNHHTTADNNNTKNHNTTTDNTNSNIELPVPVRFNTSSMSMNYQTTPTEDSNTSTDCTNDELEYCIQFIRGIPYALEQNGYTISSNHRIAKQCQLAIYDGNNTSYYQRHLDTCINTIYELGILEYLRLSDYRQRRLTIILYLNDENRTKHDGGALRCWISKKLQNCTLFHSKNNNRNNVHNDDDGMNDEVNDFFPSFDILPIGGTLVIFQSHRYVWLHTHIFKNIFFICILMRIVKESFIFFLHFIFINYAEWNIKYYHRRWIDLH
jgi:hypothetical protein